MIIIDLLCSKFLMRLYTPNPFPPFWKRVIVFLKFVFLNKEVRIKQHIGHNLLKYAGDDTICLSVAFVSVWKNLFLFQFLPWLSVALIILCNYYLQVFWFYPLYMFSLILSSLWYRFPCHGYVLCFMYISDCFSLVPIAMSWT